MKHNFREKVKKIVAGLIVACLLFNLVNVSSEPGIAPYCDLVEDAEAKS